MSLKQQGVMHIGMCDGCSRHCDLSIVDSGRSCFNYRLMINDRLVARFINRDTASCLAASGRFDDVVAMVPNVVLACDFYNAEIVPSDATFSQNKGTNIARCDGCEKRCRLAARRDSGIGGFMPYVDGKKITKYVDFDGEECFVTPEFDTMNDAKCVGYAREIAMCCKNYKSR